MTNNKKGPRSAWTFGGLGAIIWIPVLGFIFLINGNIITAAVAGVFFVLGVLYLLIFAPWRFPETSLGFLYAGLLVIMIFAAIAIFSAWYYWQLEKDIISDFNMNVFLPVLVVIVFNLFLPVLLLAKKNWNDLID